jgi:ABC-type transport system involved in multi-copper enzyme maturation permease subunit
MKKIFAISYYTVKENIRNKIFYVLIFFVLLIFLATLLFSVLGGEQELRLLLDFGLAAIELFALLLTIFASVTLVLEEIENKTIYLLLTRPLSRVEYLVGRYFGILFAVYLSIATMSIGHISLLLLKKWSFELSYFFVIFSLGFKVMLISGIAVFFSLFSTSAISSISFTFFFWLLGHFTEELKFLGSKLNIFWQYPAKFFFYLIPNFQYFNFRDRIQLGFPLLLKEANMNFISLAILYALVYSTVCLFLTNLFLSRKEF